MLDVCLLGTGGMMPLPNRWLSSVALRTKGQTALFDCGEGTQITLKMLGWGFRDISAIFISHFHADHVAGLVGMLLMIGNSYRVEELVVFGPRGMTEVLRGLRTIAPELPYPVHAQELQGGEVFRYAGIEWGCLQVDHGIPCLAYSAHVVRGRKFSVEKATALGLPVELWKPLQEGEVIDWQGQRYEPAQVLGEPRRGLKVSYVTDTRPTPELPDFVRDSDLLICEGLYGAPEDQDKAAEHLHLSFAEAAELARRGQVKELWLTHFSPAVTNPQEYANVARAIFPKSVVGYDRLCKKLRFGS